MRTVSLVRVASALALLSGAARAADFTAEQAAVGRAAFEQNCAVCHGLSLRQLPGSVLAGP